MKNLPGSSSPISAWAEDDRPREKMLLRGPGALSDAELVAILLGSGSRDESAVELARRILKEADNNLNSLGRTTIHALTDFKGVGHAKAVTLKAALELGKRRSAADITQQSRITGSSDVYALLHPKLCDLHHEEFWVLLLNRANMVLSCEQISKGGMTGTIADPKVIFKIALMKGACSIILAHNHPSGNTKPSEADISLTKKLAAAGNQLDIGVLDHLIVCDAGYYSFADEGMI